MQVEALGIKMESYQFSDAQLNHTAQVRETYNSLEKSNKDIRHTYTLIIKYIIDNRNLCRV